MKLVPLEDKVIVKPIKEEETASASGFIIQRSKDEKPSEGIVVAVGPGLTWANGETMALDVSVGDKVIFSKYSGTEVEEFLILPYKDIFAVIEESHD